MADPIIPCILHRLKSASSGKSANSSEVAMNSIPATNPRNTIIIKVSDTAEAFDVMTRAAELSEILAETTSDDIHHITVEYMENNNEDILNGDAVITSQENSSAASQEDIVAMNNLKKSTASQENSSAASVTANKKKKSKKNKKNKTKNRKVKTNDEVTDINEIESLERIPYEVPTMLNQLVFDFNLKDIANEMAIFYGTAKEKELIVSILFNYALDSKQILRNAASELLLELTVRQFINVDLIISQIELILKNSAELELDIPHVWRNLAEIIYPLFKEEYITFLDLKQKLGLTHERKYTAYPNFICNILTVLKEMQGEVWVMLVAWDNTLTKLSDFIPVGCIRLYIKQFNLNYLAKRPSIIDTKTKRISENTVQKIILDYLHLDKHKAARRILKFCTDNVGLDVDKPEFIRALTSAICLFAMGTDYRLNIEILLSYTHIISTYVSGHHLLQTTCANAVLALYEGLAVTADSAERILEIFKDQQLITKNHYYSWAMSVEDQKLKCTSPFYLDRNETFTDMFVIGFHHTTIPDFSDVEIRSKSLSTFDVYYVRQDIEETISSTRDWLYRPSYKDAFVFDLISYTMMKNEQFRAVLADLITKLVFKRLLSTSHVVAGISKWITTFVDTMVSDKSDRWERLGDIIAPILAQDAVSFKEVRRASQSLYPNDECGLFLVAILNKAKQIMGPESIRIKWNSCELKLSHFIRPGNVQLLMNEFSLHYLQDLPSRDPEEKTNKLKKEFRTIITGYIGSNKPYKIPAYVKRRVEDDYEAKKAIIPALTVILEIDYQQNQSIQHYYPTYKASIQCAIDNSDMALELQCLDSISNLVNELNFPQELLLSLFECLWDDNVISTKGFVTWKEFSNDYENIYMKQLTTFYSYIHGNAKQPSFSV